MKHHLLLSLLFLLACTGPSGPGYTIEMPEVDGLQVGDPVVRQGVAAGEVTRIDLEASHVKVSIQLEEGMSLYPSQPMRIGRFNGRRAIKFGPAKGGEQPLADGATIVAPASSDTQLEHIMEDLGGDLGDALGNMGGLLGQMGESLGVSLEENLGDMGAEIQRMIEEWDIDADSLETLIETYGDSIQIDGQNLKDWLQTQADKQQQEQ